MTEQEAHEILSQNSSTDAGRFYGDTADLSLGVGLIFESIRCPVYDPQDRLFSTVEALVYVLTHECDVDQNNVRSFNDYAAICPLIPISTFLPEYQTVYDANQLKGFLAAVAKRDVSRLIYFPPGPGILSHGALMYLNNIASTHIFEFNGRNPLAALSAYGLQVVDQMLENHLLRPKAERLSFEQ